MATEASNRMKIVIYYAAWAIVCTAAAGLLLALIHTCVVQLRPGPVRAAPRAVRRRDHRAGHRRGPGRGRAPHRKRAGALRPRVAEARVLLGLLLGLFDFAMYFVQMAVPHDRAGLASRHRHSRRRDRAGHAVRHGAAQPRLTSPEPQRALDEGLDRRLADLGRARMIARIWAHDPTVWNGDARTPEITDRLGWLRVADTMAGETAALAAFADDVRAHFTRVVLCGMGGSSLAPEVLRRTFGATAGYPVARACWTAPTPEPSAARCATVTCSRRCS